MRTDDIKGLLEAYDEHGAIDYLEVLADDEVLECYDPIRVEHDWKRFQCYYKIYSRGWFAACIAEAALLACLLVNLWVNPLLSFLVLVAMFAFSGIVVVAVNRFEKFKEHVAGEYAEYIIQFWAEVYGTIWKMWVRIYSEGIHSDYVPVTKVEKIVYLRWLHHIAEYPELIFINRPGYRLSALGLRSEYANVGEAQLDLCYYFLHNLVWDLGSDDMPIGFWEGVRIFFEKEERLSDE